MIFLTVGTQLPFDRLVRAVDAWAAAHPDMPVIAQIGQVSPPGYIPRHMEAMESLSPGRFDAEMARARLVVAHAGTGSLLKANALARPILVMPRRAALGEHRNDHQMATAAHFRHHEGIHVVEEESAIGPQIDTLLATDPVPPILPDAADPALIAALRGVIFGGGT